MQVSKGHFYLNHFINVENYKYILIGNRESLDLSFLHHSYRHGDILYSGHYSPSRLLEKKSKTGKKRKGK